MINKHKKRTKTLAFDAVITDKKLQKNGKAKHDDDDWE